MKEHITHYVEKMVGMGLLERVSIKEDRRIVRLNYTEKALPIIEEGMKIQKAFNASVIKGIETEEYQVLVDIMTRINRNCKSIIDGNAD